jgi:hypothetical protein
MCILNEPWARIGIGLFISAGHWILFAGYSIIFILSNDISILIVITIHVFGILILNLLFHDCPITLLEEKLLGNAMIDTYSGLITGEFISKGLDNKDRSQTTIQVILIALLLISVKVTLLLLKHVFHEFLEKKLT